MCRVNGEETDPVGRTVAVECPPKEAEKAPRPVTDTQKTNLREELDEEGTSGLPRLWLSLPFLGERTTTHHQGGSRTGSKRG